MGRGRVASVPSAVRRGLAGAKILNSNVASLRLPGFSRTYNSEFSSVEIHAINLLRLRRPAWIFLIDGLEAVASRCGRRSFALITLGVYDSWDAMCAELANRGVVAY